MATVLAVDDSETVRKMLKLALGASFNVKVACDGEEGLSSFNDGSSVDLVIADINMPKIGGFAMVQAIRAQNQNIPILALTAESCDAMRQRGQEAGVDGWVTKPINPAQFVEVVRRLLETSEPVAAHA
jgi:two-component system, chemotaxis family, chemotaxis protein CheY